MTVARVCEPWRVVVCEKVVRRATISCSRNDNVGGSDNYDRGYDYDFATRDDLHRTDYHHTRRLHHHHTSRNDHYTWSDDYDRWLHYDASRHHHNATCHHHLDARSVSLRNTLRLLRSFAVSRHRRSF